MARRSKKEMEAIKADFLDYLKRCQPNRSLMNMSNEFKVHAATLSKWAKEGHFVRWF